MVNLKNEAFQKIVDAITEAINQNYNDNHFDSEKALKEVQEHYSIERIVLKS